MKSSLTNCPHVEAAAERRQDGNRLAATAVMSRRPRLPPRRRRWSRRHRPPTAPSPWSPSGEAYRSGPLPSPRLPAEAASRRRVGVPTTPAPSTKMPTTAPRNGVGRVGSNGSDTSAISPHPHQTRGGRVGQRRHPLPKPGRAHNGATAASIDGDGRASNALPPPSAACGGSRNGPRQPQPAAAARPPTARPRRPRRPSDGRP